MTQTYENAICKLPLIQNIIRLIHVYKSTVSDYTKEFYIIGHKIYP